MLKLDRMDPADASLVVGSELHSRATVVTIAAKDFHDSRRFQGETPPSPMP